MTVCCLLWTVRTLHINLSRVLFKYRAAPYTPDVETSMGVVQDGTNNFEPAEPAPYPNAMIEEPNSFPVANDSERL